MEQSDSGPNCLYPMQQKTLVILSFWYVFSDNEWVIKLVSMTWTRGYKTFFMLNSTEYKFIMLINVKMPTVVGILTFISMLNANCESLKARKVGIFQ